MPRSSVSERFWSKVIEGTDGCWYWMAATNIHGYGHFNVGSEHGDINAHKWAYEFVNGPVQKGLVLHHTCNNRICVNPNHLTPVTNKQNLEFHWTNRTHCKRGHPLIELNLVKNKIKRGIRKCLTCTRVNFILWKATRQITVTITP